MRSRALTFNNKYQSGGTIGGGYNTVSIDPEIEVTPSSMPEFKLYETAQLPTVNKAALIPKVDLDKIEGHRNEVAAIFEKKAKLDREIANMSDLDILSGSNKFLTTMNEYNNLISPKLLNELKVSKQYSEDAYKSSESKKTMGEYNVKNGMFILKGQDGDIKEADAAQLKDLRDKGYTILTTGQLFHERDTNPQLAFKHIIDNRLSYGVGADELRKRWRDQLNVGFTEGGHKHDNYRLIQQAVNGEVDVFEENVGGGHKIKHNYKQLESAIESIYGSMSQEEKDSLNGILTNRLLSQNAPVTNETINAEMVKYFGNLEKSRQDYSKVTEQRTNLGTNLTGNIGGGGRANQFPELGKFEAAAMGFGVKSPYTLQQGSKKIEMQTVVMPEGLERPNGKPISFNETKYFKNFSDGSQARLLNGAKVDTKAFVPDSETRIGFAYKNVSTGQYDITSPQAEQASKKYDAAFSEFKSKYPNASAEQVATFNNNLTAELKRNYNVEKVTFTEGYLPADEKYTANMKEGEGFTYAHADDIDQIAEVISNATGKPKADNVWWFNPEYMRTTVVMPVKTNLDIRVGLDGNKVTTKDRGSADAGTLVERYQQGNTDGAYRGADLNFFNNK